MIITIITELLKLSLSIGQLFYNALETTVVSFKYSYKEYITQLYGKIMKNSH